MNVNKKDVFWNAVGSTFNAFVSLFFTIATTRINGSREAGVFSLAFATASITYIIGSYIVRVFQVTDISGVYSDADYIYHRIVTCLMMLFASFGFVIVKNYDSYKATIIIIMCLVRCIDAFAEVVYGLLQKNEKLSNVGISLCLRSFCSVVTFIGVDLLTKNLLLASISLVLVYLATVVFFDLKNTKKIEFSSSCFSIRKIANLFKVGFTTFYISILGIYIVNASRYAIDDFMTEEKQTIFGIIIMPATIMALLSQYIIQPLLTKIADCLKNNRIEQLKKLNLILLFVMLGLGVIILFVAYFIEEPVLSFIYGLNLKPYKTEMILVVFGAIFYGVQTVFSNVLIALRKTTFQSIALSLISVVATITSYALVPLSGILGATISYLITMLLLSVLFVWYIFVSLNKLQASIKKSKIH